ncbi:NRDE family protein [Acidaminobacter sp. JC074]|uniref:NRDE family protein n=1 Tax=Acidaminobacter sp. JC074 TaxID=2530199 RepID=UPI001F110478|nr:NRDE family protein [Acidaminobacter sp. JC074]MCH4889787.1 NRDE family protein [Acidaminobacter sp. JC074]
MCTILFAYKTHSKFPLIYLGNRDEFYKRPTERAKFHGQVLMGKDLEKGGTWFGFHKNGRIGFLTNYRDMKAIKENTSTRGHLITNYLESDLSPRDYLKSVHAEIQNYNGFNLILGSFDDLIYYSSHLSTCQTLEPGVYGLSNAHLNTPWFKVENGKRKLSQVDEVKVDDLFEILKDKTLADDAVLPSTGLDYSAEKGLSSLFVTFGTYGTVYQQVILYDGQQVDYYDRTIEDDFKKTHHLQMTVGDRHE